jgi:large subunit ribosomal protein L4
MNKKERRIALKSALSAKVNDQKFIVVDELKLDEVKTKNMVNVLANLKVGKALIVLNNEEKNVVLSARNIPTVKTATTNTINVYDLLKYDVCIVTKNAVATIEEVYA